MCLAREGTYIRKLCSDIGDKLNVKSQMIELRRVKAGPFCENSKSLISLDKLRNLLELYEEETNFGEEIYNTDIKVLQDDCKYNDNVNRQTIFEINDLRVPIINVKSLDNGDSNEKFGSLLTQNPAWLR